MDGKYAASDKNKQTYPEDRYSLFALHGEYSAYNDQGTVITEGSHIYGEVTGVWKYYDNERRLLRSVTLENNIKSGPFEVYCNHETDGYHMQAKGSYKNDRRSGEWSFYNTNGTIMCTVTYENGIPNGKAQQYNNAGVMVNEGSFENGKPSTLWKRYKDDGSYIGEAKPTEAYVFQHEITEFFVVLVIRYN
jgi:antitoxin component YwqK of YwqJK toxin-antitoxin module